MSTPAATEATTEVLRATVERHNGLVQAWNQVNYEQLASALRAMPVKLRNRMLSAHRTPSSKVSPTTARLLTTNIARGGLRDRLSAAEVITQPIVRELGAASDDACGSLEKLRQPVRELVEEWGDSVVVLAAISGLLAEAERFAPVLAACDDEGLLSEDLRALATELRPAVEAQLAVQRDEMSAVADDAGASDTAEAGDIGSLRALHAQAFTAGSHLTATLETGCRPAEEDLAAIRRFADALDAGAERYGVAPEIDAVIAAVDAEGVRAALVDLVARVRSLTGPDTLTGPIDELRSAAALAEEDPDLARRLRTFLDVLDSAEPLERFRLAGELRSQPPPPHSVLLDAALAGLLRVEAAPSSREVRSEPLPVEPIAAELVPVEPIASEADAEVVSQPDAVEPAEIASEPLAEVASKDDLAETTLTGASTQSEKADEAATGDTVSTAAASISATGPSGAESRPGTPSDTEGPAELSRATEDAEVQEPGEVSSVTAGIVLSELVASRRFGLAHHLAKALGQKYRAAILAEAALAQAVRSPSTDIVSDLVASTLTVELHAADVGSVVLRAAAATRVALLDPASGAPAVLRQIIPALDSLPQIRDFVVAVASATEQGLFLPAAGVAIDAAEALERARAIASWAEDTLRRPPRQNRLYRGIEIWKGWMTRTGMLGRILSMVAANNPELVAEVRNACAELADRRQREDAIETADRTLRQGRAGGAQRIIGPAREHLIRGMEEIVEQAVAWCDSCAPLASGEHGTALREDLATQAFRLRQSIKAELHGLAADDWSHAAAKAAGAMLTQTVGLLANEGLNGSELTVSDTLNRELALVAGLELDDDLCPERPPTVAELVLASRTSRPAAFASRLTQADFGAAEAIIDLRNGDGFDEVEARQQLRANERERLEQVEQRWAMLDARFAAARARGRISDGDVVRLYGVLLEAKPRSRESGDRRNLGRVEHELEALARDLDDAAGRRREIVADDVADAVAAGELSEAWITRLNDLLARDEIGAAEEYLHRALAGGALPDPADISHGPDRILADVLAAGAEVTPEIVDEAAAGGQLGGLDFSAVADLDRPSVGAALAAWRTLAGPNRLHDLDAALAPVLRLLGIIPTKIERGRELRAASTKGRWFVDVHGDTSGNAYVPDFGSRAAGRRRFMLSWEHLPVSQLWDLAAANAPADQPMYVLHFGVLPAEARSELARHARRRDGARVVVIDEAVILACALIGQQSYDVTMRAVLPYAAPNPYDPDLLAGTPVEMFYGRRAEREKIKAPAGSSFISGGRRFGKTALLRSVQAELEGTDVLALLIVIQHVAAVPPNDPAELWPVLAARLIEAGVLPAGTGGTADEVSAGVRAWLGKNPGRRLLLLLDECDFFLQADAVSRFANVVRLRDLMQYGERRFKVVFSGLQHVARYRKLPNQPLSTLPQPLVIGPLDPASAIELVRRPLHALGWDVSDAQVDRIVTFCACNPSVLQLACGQLLERLRHQPVQGLAPWPVPEDILNELLRSSEVERGVRDRLFLTLELDHRYKLLAYLLALRSLDEGLGIAASPAELRHQALEYWPEGFAGQNPDDVRALCDELVGLGVFAGDAEVGYRMLSPATVQLFGSIDEIAEELIAASDMYESNVTAGAAGNRIALGDGRFSPLTAAQLSDVVGMGTTQLRVIAGSRALRAESVPQALAVACAQLPGARTVELTGTSLRQWRDSMSAPADGHLVVVSDMAFGRSPESWEQSIEAARRRGAARTARGTRSAVLVAGPSDRAILRRLVTTTDGRRGDLADVAVGLRRVDLPSLRAWDRIEELDLAHPIRQARLLEVTGGWPMLIERVVTRMRQRPFEDAITELETELATLEGARRLIAAVGLDSADRDQPADAGLAFTFARLAEDGWRETAPDLAKLLELYDDLAEEDPAEAIAILALLATLDVDEEGIVAPESVLASCIRLVLPKLVPAEQ